MNVTSSGEPNSQLRFIQELIDENVEIDGDVVQVARNTWAIHAVIPVDGEVIVAEFDSYDQAKVVLNQIAQPQPSGPAPEQPDTTVPR